MIDLQPIAEMRTVPVTIAQEWAVFQAWWIGNSPGLKMPSRASHIFGAWMASVRHREIARQLAIDEDQAA